MTWWRDHKLVLVIMTTTVRRTVRAGTKVLAEFVGSILLQLFVVHLVREGLWGVGSKQEMYLTRTGQSGQCKPHRQDPICQHPYGSPSRTLPRFGFRCSSHGPTWWHPVPCHQHWLCQRILTHNTPPCPRHMATLIEGTICKLVKKLPLLVPSTHPESTPSGPLSHWRQEFTLPLTLLEARPSNNMVRAFWKVFMVAMNALRQLAKGPLCFGI